MPAQPRKPLAENFALSTELLDQYVPTTDRRCALPQALALGVLLRSIVVEREPIYREAETVHAYAASLFGLEEAQLRQLSDDRLGRALDRLYDADRAALLTSPFRPSVRQRVRDPPRASIPSVPGATGAGDYALSVAQPPVVLDPVRAGHTDCRLRRGHRHRLGESVLHVEPHLVIVDVSAGHEANPPRECPVLNTRSATITGSPAPPGADRRDSSLILTDAPHAARIPQLTAAWKFVQIKVEMCGTCVYSKDRVI